MTAVSHVLQAPTTMRIESTKIEEMERIAFELGRMLRRAYKDHIRTVETYRMVMEETNEATVATMSDSYRSWVPLIGKISATAASVLGIVMTSVFCQTEEGRKQWGYFRDTLPSLASSGTDVYSNYVQANRTTWQALMENSKSLSADSQKKILEIFSQLSEELRALQKLEEEKAQTLRAMSR